MKKQADIVKSEVIESLRNFEGTPVQKAALGLFGCLGYRSKKTFDLSPNTPKNFLETFDPHERFRRKKGFFSQWKNVDILFQITDEEINTLGSDQLRLEFDSSRTIENEIIRSYLFLTLELREDHYTRTDLSNITREINRLFPMPVLVLFKIGKTLTFSIINRRLHKKDSSKDVLEKVTLIKDIRFNSPHRAHIEILYDLSFSLLFDRYQVMDFVTLHKAWQKTLDTNELNRRFYRELANWYFWAVHQVAFPSMNDIPETIRNPVNVIRLITRMIFVWFVKEKGLIPEDLFNRKKIGEILNDFSPDSSSYYKAILQNLFFATLNTRMDDRKFREDRRYQGKNNGYMLHNRFRYEAFLKEPKKLLHLVKDIPFLNGGLFECLDRESDPVTRIDGFSDRKDSELNAMNPKLGWNSHIFSLRQPERLKVTAF